MILKVFSLVHFLSILLWKEQMITSVRKMLKTLVCSAQNRSFSSEICLENNPKIGRFFYRLFIVKFALKFSVKLANFSTYLSPKIPQNLTFFYMTYQKSWWIVRNPFKTGWPCLRETIRYVPKLNFKTYCFLYWGKNHVIVSILLFCWHFSLLLCSFNISLVINFVSISAFLCGCFKAMWLVEILPKQGFVYIPSWNLPDTQKVTCTC